MQERILTADELAEIERLDKSRTEGEWRYDGQHNEITSPRSEDYWLIVSECRSAPDQQYECDEFGHQYDANFAFVAACSTAVPALLATIKRLRVVIARVYDHLEHYRDCPARANSAGSCDCGLDDMITGIEALEIMTDKLEAPCKDE